MAMEEGIPVVTDNSFLLAEHPLVEQSRAPDVPRFPAQRSGILTFLSGRQMRCRLSPERTGAGRLGRRPPDVGAPQHAAVHGLP